jgi:hypothetical protein
MSELRYEGPDTPSAAPSVFARQGYIIEHGLITQPLIEFFWSYLQTKFASLLLPTADPQIPNTPSIHGDSLFDGLLEYLRPRVEALSERRLFPTYSYCRLYKRGDVLKRHRDRPACEISLSLNIGQTPSASWPLHIEGKAGHFAAYLLPGDALLYRGIDCPHWRDPFEGDQLAQVFLHYVDRYGPHADQKFDGRPSLMRPREHNATQEDQAAKE